MRDALLMAVGTYGDAELNQLRSPNADARGLREVLEDPSIGGFHVQELIDRTSYESRRLIQQFFANRNLDDLLLIHISCHGIKDDEGRLFFACTDTETDYLDTTAVPAMDLHNWMQRCRARSIVMLLDCCYSGAFSGGSKGDQRVHIGDSFRGTGRAVLTASNALEYAFEGGELTDQHARSVFTASIIDGLRTGEADRNADGRVSVDDLYEHVYRAAKRDGGRQTPQKYLFDVSGDLVIAASPDPEQTRALPQEVREALAGVLPEERMSAVRLLADVLSEGGAGARQAELALERLAGDDSRRVSAAAMSALGRTSQPAADALSGAGATAGSLPASDTLVDGVELLAGMLARTLGPEPASVVIGSGQETRWTSDSLEIVSDIEPEGRLRRVGSDLLKQMVVQLRHDHHDGGATAAVVLAALVRRLDAAVAGGSRPPVLRRELDAAIHEACSYLRSVAVDLESKDQLRQALATSLADEGLADLIAEALDKVGREGVITVEESDSLNLELQVTEGMRVDKGFLSAHFVTDADRMEAVLDEPYILLANQKVSRIKDLLPLLEKVIQAGRPLLVLAEDVDGEALATLTVNKASGTFASVAVAAPGVGDRRRTLLQDVAILTGGQVISAGVGTSLESTGLELLGRARRVVVTQDDTTIIDGAGSGDQIIGRIEQIRAEIDECDSDYDREKLQERMAKLAGGVATIRVGTTPGDASAARRKNAVRGVALARSMVALGLAPGGSSALARCAAHLRAQSRPSASAEVTLAVADALEAPLRQLCANAGVEEADEVIQSVRDADSSIGYNLLTRRVGDPAREGVWDLVDVQVGIVEAVGKAASEFLGLL